MKSAKPQDTESHKVAGQPDIRGAASGVRNREAELHLVRQVLSCLWVPDGKPEEEVARMTTAALARMVELAPADPAEGMLVGQMIATHEAAMECMRRAMLSGQTSMGRDQNLKHATKLMGVYERQLAALDKRRGRGQQKVTVEHVHVAAGGQAIVGSVTTGGRETTDAAASLERREAERAGFLDAAPAKAPAARRRKSG